ncbi:MAG TPA: hypothetical protein VML75_29355 [Kofleriaceae bacterium]|nr:hypothetical protein [Kofleriaceae bacterium]
MKEIKHYRRMVRRRVEAALRLEMRPPDQRTRGAAPVIDPLLDPIPSEVIDLHTGPFEARFPELASRARSRIQRG